MPLIFGKQSDIENVKISDVQDKAISVGEQSFIRISEEVINIGWVLPQKTQVKHIIIQQLETLNCLLQ